MKRSGTLSVSTTSFERKLRNRTLDVKSSRDMKFNGCPPFSSSLFTSASSINTNHSRARLELLTARVTPTLTHTQLGEEENKKLSTHVPDDSDPVFLRPPLPLKRSSTTISYEDLLRKYSCTSNDNSLHDYNPDDCRQIMKKYSATNGEDMTKGSRSMTSHGDVLRKYSVSGYDEILQNYSPTKCKNILKKYTESETNQHGEKGEYYKDALSVLETESQRSSQNGGKRSLPSKQDVKRRKRGEARNGSRLTKDINSTTKIGNKLQNACGISSPKHKLRKGNTAGAPTRKTINKEGNRVEMKGTRVSQTTVIGKHGADKMKHNSRKTKDSKMNLRNVSAPGTSSQQNLGRACNTSSFSVGHNPALSIWGNGERDEELERATTRATTLPHGQNVDGYYDEIEEENGVRLYHLLSRQALESSVVPSTPVDRKDLSQSTPGSIYEKMESEYRRKRHKKAQVQKSKTQMSNAITLKSHQRKHAGKLVLEKLKHNRAENYISRSLMPIESQNRLDTSMSASVCSDCLEGRFRQISCKDCHVIRYHEKIAGSQKRAYDVYAETGERATKPGDLMEVVRYLNKSNMDGAKESKKEEERKAPEADSLEEVNGGVFHSSDNRGGSSNSLDIPLCSEDKTIGAALGSPFDFLDDYVRLQTGGMPGKENVSPGTPLLCKNGNVQQQQQQQQQQENSGKSLDEMRRQSVESWLKKRGRYLRSKLGYESTGLRDFLFA